MNNIKEYFQNLSTISAPKDQRSFCKKCGLYKKCDSPYMKPYGKFKKEILIIGESPETIEYEPRNLLNDVFEELEIDLVKDCLFVNSVDCSPIGGRLPTDNEIRLCSVRKENIITNYKPKVILLLGKPAIDSFYKFNKMRSPAAKVELASLRGKIIPDIQTNSWICHSYPSDYILKNNEDKIKVFYGDLLTVKKALKRKRPIEYFSKTKSLKIKIITKYKKLIQILDDLITNKLDIVFDYETSSFRYHEKIHDAYLVSFQTITNGNIVSKEVTYCFPFEKTNDDANPFWTKKQLKSVYEKWNSVLTNCKLIAQHIQHEYHASIALCKTDPLKLKKQFKWDTMLGCRTLDESPGITGLKFQAYQNFGQEPYSLSKYTNADIGKKNTFNQAPFKKACLYCCIDTFNTKKLYLKQVKKIEKKGMIKGYNLLHNSAIQFSDMSQAGIKLNLSKLKKMITKEENVILQLKDQLLSHKLANKFKLKTGKKLRIGKEISNVDLKVIVFDIMKIKPTSFTKKGNNSLDINVLKEIQGKSDFIDLEIQLRKNTKLLSVLNNFNKYRVDEYLHPSFLLDTARTYRSSSKEPNFQNVPKRDEDLKSIRELIIPRYDLIAEVDYGAMEVRIIASWSKDKTLCEFIEQGFDFHTEWTKRNLQIVPDDFVKEVWSKLRFSVKNAFVFALFYGSYYKNIAFNLWDAISKIEPTILPKKYSTWENHLQEQEVGFWEMFSGVKKKQMEAIAWYKDHGFIKQIGWGFERHGYLTRNIIANTHIQGPAFLCLLWAINKIGEVKHKYQSLFCGQIHDALFIDVKKEEKESIKETVTDIMVNKIREENKWLITPLEVEWSFGTNWNNLKEEK